VISELRGGRFFHLTSCAIGASCTGVAHGAFTLPWFSGRSVFYTRAASATAVGLTMKLVGKPDAGNRHIRFDERGQETECCHMAQATAPVLDSTGRREFITLLGGAAAAANFRGENGGTRTDLLAQKDFSELLMFIEPELSLRPRSERFGEGFLRDHPGSLSNAEFATTMPNALTPMNAIPMATTILMVNCVT
jgi:hypothetical protein